MAIEPLEESALDYQAEMLASKIKHYLITSMGVTFDEATNEEFYRAFTLTLREEVMINWTATWRTIRRNNARTLYYICMEHMPGRFGASTIANMNARELVTAVMKKMGRKTREVISLEPEPGLGNGGLGRLASCLIDSLATQKYPAMAYGLRYQYGIFDQEIWDGVQVERPDTWLRVPHPWEFRRDEAGVNIHFCGRPIPAINRKGVEIFDLADFEEVRALAYDLPIVGYSATPDFSVLTLRLWSTKESPRNFQLQRFNAGQLDQAAENSSLTDVLYPNDNNEVGKRMRLKQEFLLSSASLQDIISQYLMNNADLSGFPDKVRIQINDTHPALIIAELIRILLNKHDFSFVEAWEVARTCCGYTNHTILKESLEEWNENRMRYLVPRQYKIIERLNLEMCNLVRKRAPNDEEKVRRMSMIEGGQVRMAHVAIYESHRVNGVAALHTELLKKEIFKDFYDLFPEKFVSVTNGVSQRRWLLHANPLLAEFISKRIGKGWITDFREIKKLADFAQDPKAQEEFLQIKKANKRALIEYCNEKNPLRDAHGHPMGHYAPLPEDALYDVHIKRIHEYKRQLMKSLHIILVMKDLMKNPEARAIKRVVFFSGKAAPGYDMAKNIIRLINCLSRRINTDPLISSKLRVIFIENYNVNRAELLIPAADLSEQISTAGYEASGTGNMKLAMNGALTIATEDGATIEMHQEIGDAYWPFGFGKNAAENVALRATYSPSDIYNHNSQIKEAVDALRDHSLAENEDEHQTLLTLSRTLLDGDKYFVLNDLPDYYAAQKRVEELFLQPSKWAEMCIHNMARMGKFSSDRSIEDYSKEVWNLTRCPPDPDILAMVRDQYSEHDKCRIFVKKK